LRAVAVPATAEGPDLLTNVQHRRFLDFARGAARAAMLVLFAAPLCPAPARAITLDQVRSWEYVIDGDIGTPGYEAAIGASRSDMVVTGGGGNGLTLDRGVADPKHDKLILGYVDVSEAANWSTPQFFKNGTVPSWFGNPNPGFTGLYTVRYWNPNWPPALHAQIDQIAAAGYDGVFLDVLSGDSEWSAGNDEGNPVYPHATEAMATLMTELRSYVAGKHIGRPFYLLGNNPTSVAQDYPAALKTLDGITNEVLYYRQPPDNGFTSVYIGTSFAQYLATQIAPLYRAAGIPIFGNDYPNPLTDLAADFRSFEFYTALGWPPSVTTGAQTDAIFSTGPFMAMAVPGNTIVKGVDDFANFLSGGLVRDATLIGGNEGGYFIGGPGRNTITAGAGANIIYAHPASAGLKNQLVLQFLTGAVNPTKTPAVRILVNGKVVVPDYRIRQDFNYKHYRNQILQIDVTDYTPIASLEIDGLNLYYDSADDYSDVFIESLAYQGQSISFNLGTYAPYSESLNNGLAALLNANGWVKFPASAFQMPSPFLHDTRDTIAGGPGSNIVVYRGASSDYTIAKQSNGSYLVTTSVTAEGPDVLTNVQNLQFTDKLVTLPEK
jgi:hypothetical protein